MARLCCIIEQLVPTKHTGAASKPDRVVRHNRSQWVTMSSVVHCVCVGVWTSGDMFQPQLDTDWSPVRNKIKKKSAVTVLSDHRTSHCKWTGNTAFSSHVGFLVPKSWFGPFAELFLLAEADKWFNEQGNYNLYLFINTHTSDDIQCDNPFSWLQIISQLLISLQTTRSIISQWWLLVLLPVSWDLVPVLMTRTLTGS